MTSEAAAPGVAVGVVRHGEAVYTRAFGLASLDDEVAVDLDMQFEIGSISKPMTAIVVLRLVEEGRLRIDDTVGRWLGD